MYRWSQESVDNLKKIAYDAVALAQQTPHKWINPLASHLQSRVRYAHVPSEIEAFLIDAGADDEEASEFAQTCTNGFFQVYFPTTNFLAGDTEAAGAADTLRMNWYREISALGYSDEIIRLIKQMGGIETEKIQSIKSR